MSSAKTSETAPDKKIRWLPISRKAIICLLAHVVFLSAFFYVLIQLSGASSPHPSVFWTYFALALLPASALMYLLISLKSWIHRNRLEDKSIVHSLFAEAAAICDNADSDCSESNNSDITGCKKCLNEEVNRLREIGKDMWTEYECLSLNQQLLRFLSPDALIARAQSKLEELEDYALDDAYGGYDQRQYGNWEERMRKFISNIERLKDKKNVSNNSEVSSLEPQLSDATQVLRSNLSTLIEHVADYHKNWSEGSTRIYALRIFFAVAVPTFLAMGLLPLLHPHQSVRVLSVVNWGYVGVAGAMTAVLHALFKSNNVEVGNTSGKKEVSGTLQGSVFGLVAGMLMYSAIAGGLLDGSAFPDLTSSEIKMAVGDVFLSVLWAFVAGFFFEHVFGQIFARTIGNYQ